MLRLVLRPLALRPRPALALLLDDERRVAEERLARVVAGPDSALCDAPDSVAWGEELVVAIAGMLAS